MNIEAKDIPLMDKILKLHLERDTNGFRRDINIKELNIDKKYYSFLINQIIEFSEYVQEIVFVIRTLQPHFEPIDIITERFVNDGGFAAYYQDKIDQYNEAKEIDQLKKVNLELQNNELEYKATIRDQEQRIRDLEEADKFLSVLKKYWWLFLTVLSLGYAIGSLISKFL
jgi:hypothetical protein